MPPDEAIDPTSQRADASHTTRGVLQRLATHLETMSQALAEVDYDRYSAIYDALAARDPSAAEQAMRTHVRSLRGPLRKVWNLVRF